MNYQRYLSIIYFFYHASKYLSFYQSIAKAVKLKCTALICTLNYMCNLLYIYAKGFYTRGTLRSVRISRLAKIPIAYRNWLNSLN